MRRELEAIESKLDGLINLLPPLLLPDAATELQMKFALQWAQNERTLVDNYQGNASADDEEIVERLDKKFAFAINKLSDGFDFRDDLKFNRLNLDRIERLLLSTVEGYKPGVATEEAVVKIRELIEVS